MRTAPRLAASLIALATLGACGGFTSSGPDTTTAPATTLPPPTSTTISPAVLKAALLTPADVPGSKASTTPPSDDIDVSACFPGNPLGVKTDPNEVDGPDLELTQRLVGRGYGSSARTATQEQAAAFITTFASPSGAACVVNASKKAIADDPTPPKRDASSLTGSSKAVPIAEGGAVLSLKGNIVSADKAVVAIEVELIAFRKGRIVVLMDADAFMGPLVPGQGVALAQKIAARLP